jgi:hypothetical protein
MQTLPTQLRFAPRAGPQPRLREPGSKFGAASWMDS